VASRPCLIDSFTPPGGDEGGITEDHLIPGGSPS